MKVLFVNTLGVSYYEKFIGNVTKSFSDLVISNKMIENAIKSGNIEVEENEKNRNCEKGRKTDQNGLFGESVE